MGTAAKFPPFVCFKWPWGPSLNASRGASPSPCGDLELPWLFKSIRTIAQGLVIAGDIPSTDKLSQPCTAPVEADRGDAEQRALAAALVSGRATTVLEFYSSRCRLCSSLQGLVRELEDGADGCASFVLADAEDDRWLPEAGRPYTTAADPRHFPRRLLDDSSVPPPPLLCAPLPVVSRRRPFTAALALVAAAAPAPDSLVGYASTGRRRGATVLLRGRRRRAFAPTRVAGRASATASPRPQGVRHFIHKLLHYDVRYVPCFVLLDKNGRALAKTGVPTSRQHVIAGLHHLLNMKQPCEQEGKKSRS